MAIERCGWAGDDPDYVTYHDSEWGVPVTNERHLFEMMVLEGAQAGLSWITILRKRENYRRAFDDFEPEKIARYTERRRQKLLADVSIVRNRAKIDAAIGNARALLQMRDAGLDFCEHLWSFTEGGTVVNRWKTASHVPATSPVSEMMSKDLKRRGFKFVGPTICYSLMQATGMVNDHITSCFRHEEVRAIARR